jgi:bifunctional DNase/RNase
MGLIPFVVTKDAGVNLSDGRSVVVLRVGEVMVHFPIIMTPFDTKCVMSMAAGLEFYDQAFPNVMGNILDGLGASLERIVIANGTATDEDGKRAEVSIPVICLRQGEKDFSVVAFAGDAISLALARNAPMFIQEEVFMRGIESEEVKNLLDMIGRSMPEILEN